MHHLHNLPIEIVDYIWTFDGRHLTNFNNCISELNDIFKRYIQIYVTSKRYYKTSWFWKKFEYYEHKFYIQKIRERNSFNRVICD